MNPFEEMMAQMALIMPPKKTLIASPRVCAMILEEFPDGIPGVDVIESECLPEGGKYAYVYSPEGFER